WFADSGSTFHITSRCRGTVAIRSKVENRIVRFNLHNVLHVPTASSNLLFIAQLDEASGRVHMGDSCALIMDKCGATLAVGKKQGQLYQLNLEPIFTASELIYAMQEDTPHTWDEWH
ncbi:uncharacterized protein LAESUDRAFT_631479, partial [Laetiporus sulphureus 93-53]